MESYTAAHRMRDLISDNSLILMVLSRFGIPLGFADNSVGTVCDNAGVDTATFLGVANYISHKTAVNARVKPEALMSYLRKAHEYFLDFQLPGIRRKLLAATDCSTVDEVGFLVLKFFDEYVLEVRRHMDYENATVFTYVDNLLQGNPTPDNYDISVFAAHHNDIETKLSELKDIIVRYYPKNGNDMLYSALFDIINTAQDLNSHCAVEDHLLVPAVRDLETRAAGRRNKRPHAVNQAVDKDKFNALSSREKEVLAQIAMGKSNKDIAAALCLSVHTVTTHRRNIGNKLQIHSPAALTIFAIINNLVDIHDIKLL